MYNKKKIIVTNIKCPICYYTRNGLKIKKCQYCDCTFTTNQCCDCLWSKIKKKWVYKNFAYILRISIFGNSVLRCKMVKKWEKNRCTKIFQCHIILLILVNIFFVIVKGNKSQKNGVYNFYLDIEESILFNNSLL